MYINEKDLVKKRNLGLSKEVKKIAIGGQEEVKKLGNVNRMENL